MIFEASFGNSIWSISVAHVSPFYTSYLRTLFDVKYCTVTSVILLLEYHLRCCTVLSNLICCYYPPWLILSQDRWRQRDLHIIVQHVSLHPGLLPTSASCPVALLAVISSIPNDSFYHTACMGLLEWHGIFNRPKVVLFALFVRSVPKTPPYYCLNNTHTHTAV